MANAVQRERVAAAIRRALHEFTDRIFTDDQFHAVEDASAALEVSAAAGEQRTLQERQEAFAAQMLHEIGDGHEFSPFSESPYSGELNPVSPISAVYRREGDTIVGDVMIGPAYTGAPGRAHGGMVAAVFDDVMGAVQRLTSHVGYTRELTVNYRAPFPVDEVVTISASETSCDERIFVVEATAMAGHTLVAEATATFTRVDPTRFR
ncbi:MAG: PaaI family thioesterase [Acidimicrobiales bacterium]|nr:PaaI family thioesterase [Acidimicrobiales bacterium]